MEYDMFDGGKSVFKKEEKIEWKEYVLNACIVTILVVFLKWLIYFAS